MTMVMFAFLATALAISGEIPTTHTFSCTVASLQRWLPCVVLPGEEQHTWNGRDWECARLHRDTPGDKWARCFGLKEPSSSQTLLQTGFDTSNTLLRSCPTGYNEASRVNEHIFVEEAGVNGTFEYILCECEVKLAGACSQCPSKACSATVPQYDTVGSGEFEQWVFKVCAPHLTSLSSALLTISLCSVSPLSIRLLSKLSLALSHLLILTLIQNEELLVKRQWSTIKRYWMPGKTSW